MMRTIYKVIDKLLVLFIFLNVFAFDFFVGGLPLRYLALGGSFILTLFAAHKEVFNRIIFRFLFTIFVLYSILFLYSILCGNKIENILSFLRPLSIFVIIPSLSFMSRVNGIERYLNAFIGSVLLLIAFFCGLLVLSFIDPPTALHFSESQDLIMILNYNFIPRIIIKTFVFVIPTSFFFFNKYDGVKLNLIFVFFLIVSALSQTYALTIGIVLMYIISLKKKGNSSQLIFSLVMYLIFFLFLYTTIGQTALEMWDAKGDSVYYKEQQLSNFSKDMDGMKLLLGRGIGAEFVNMDSRHIKESVIEVAAVQLFQYGGLIFSWIILYTYVLVVLPDIKRKFDDPRFFISVSQIGIFMASMSNPYLWGGGMGLFFVVLSVSYRASLIKSKL